MKFGQVIEYNKRKNFFKIYAENEAARPVPVLSLFFTKTLYEKKANDL